ncbi:chitin binding domain-containing protein [Donghicola sp. C2-DW-16]|uniref:Chitin binding domain-containing protein n=1 Tax=Donghicola mangrovi TaxID=2729614 RepID=A0A850Q1R6_9RHOB|nr:chitin binding peritrophin-A domain-containing protein [Donghicola mangrovi]NVO23547.1 chitin binding domain-containing protein [Donghicola mangrovi]NVO26995.1 chitin binding domain-containing protein [Donghicola mangrovi]
MRTTLIALMLVIAAPVIAQEATTCAQVQCPQITSVLIVHMPHPEDCAKYCKCNGSTVTEVSCPEGLAFNADLRICDQPQNVQCSVTKPE